MGELSLDPNGRYNGIYSNKFLGDTRRKILSLLKDNSKSFTKFQMMDEFGYSSKRFTKDGLSEQYVMEKALQQLRSEGLIFYANSKWQLKV